MTARRHEVPEVTPAEIRARSENVLNRAGLLLLGDRAIYESNVRNEDHVTAYYFLRPDVMTDREKGGGLVYGVTINQSISNDDWMKVGIRVFDKGLLQAVWAGERTEDDEDAAQVLSFGHRFLDLRSVPWGAHPLRNELESRGNLRWRRHDS